MQVDYPVISDRLAKELHGLLCGEVALCVQSAISGASQIAPKAVIESAISDLARPFSIR